MRLDVGPILRSIARRKSVFSLVVLELASGFTIISCLFIASAWYRQVGAVQPAPHEQDLIEVVVHRPAASSDLALATRDNERLVATAAATHAVVAAAHVSTTLLDDRFINVQQFQAHHDAPRGAGKGQRGWTVQVGTHLPEVVGMRVREGQLPAPERREGAVLLTVSLRRALFGDGPAIGRRVSSGELPEGTVAAVIDDLPFRRAFLQDTDSQAFHFAPLRNEREARFLVRAQPGQRPAVMAALRGALHAGPHAVVLVHPHALEQARHYVFTRGLIVILMIVAVQVGLIALVGALAVSSFLVAERTRQVGVRRALGATRSDIIRDFLVENSIAIALGTALGLLITWGLLAVMRATFTSLTLDVRFLWLTAILLWLDATLAAVLPALRAARVPPSVAARAV